MCFILNKYFNLEKKAFIFTNIVPISTVLHSFMWTHVSAWNNYSPKEVFVSFFFKCRSPDNKFSQCLIIWASFYLAFIFIVFFAGYRNLGWLFSFSASEMAFHAFWLVQFQMLCLLYFFSLHNGLSTPLWLLLRFFFFITGFQQFWFSLVVTLYGFLCFYLELLAFVDL